MNFSLIQICFVLLVCFLMFGDFSNAARNIFIFTKKLKDLIHNN